MKNKTNGDKDSWIKKLIQFFKYRFSCQWIDSMVDVVRKRASEVEDRLEEILIQQKLQHGKREGHTMESNGRGKCVQLN